MRSVRGACVTVSRLHLTTQNCPNQCATPRVRYQFSEQTWHDSMLLLQHHLMSVMEDNKAAAGHGQHSPSSTDSGSWVNDTMELGTSRRYMKEDCLLDTHWENLFKHAAAFNYVGNLIFRLAHNFVFGCVSRCRGRWYSCCMDKRHCN